MPRSARASGQHCRRAAVRRPCRIQAVLAAELGGGDYTATAGKALARTAPTQGCLRMGPPGSACLDSAVEGRPCRLAAVPRPPMLLSFWPHLRLPTGKLVGGDGTRPRSQAWLATGNRPAQPSRTGNSAALPRPARDGPSLAAPGEPACERTAVGFLKPPCSGRRSACNASGVGLCYDGVQQAWTTARLSGSFALHEECSRYLRCIMLRWHRRAGGEAVWVSLERRETGL